MSFFQLIFVVILPWALIHLLHVLYRGRVHVGTPFPASINALQPRALFDLHFKLRRQDGSLELGALWLKYETTRWNWLFSWNGLVSCLPRILLTRKIDPSSLNWLRRLFRGFYTIGSAICVCLCTLGTLFLFWKGSVFTSGILIWLVGAGGEQSHRIVKRATGDLSPSPSERGNDLHSLIPGVTTSIWELPLLFIALTLNAAFHEAGHAISAALESIPTLSAGFHLYVAIPAFFVTLPDVSIPMVAKLRIANAGPWHNVCVWVVFAFLGFSGISGMLYTGRDSTPTRNDTCKLSDLIDKCGISTVNHQSFLPFTLWSYLGYVDTRSLGLAVTYVSPESPLHGHLMVGSIIVGVDDRKLVSEKALGSESLDLWYSHLSMTLAERTRLQQEDEGWCVSDHWFDFQDDRCCRPNTTQRSTEGQLSSSASCFKPRASSGAGSSNDSPLRLRCLDPAPLFTYQHRITYGGLAPESVAHSFSPDNGNLYGSRCRNECPSPPEANSSYTCVQPYLTDGEDDQVLTRLELRDPPWLPVRSESPPTRILVYKGPTSEILDHVLVGFIQPRTSLFPPIFFPRFVQVTIPAVVGLLCEYISRTSLSLAFFNLLPIQGLDGGVLFSCVLKWLLSDGSGGRPEEMYDLETLEQGESQRGQQRGSYWKSEHGREIIEGLVSVVTIAMGVLVMSATVWEDIAS